MIISMLTIARSQQRYDHRLRNLVQRTDAYVSSDQLRRWCEHNRDRCYIPDWLLKRWGMPVDPNVM